MVSRRHLKRRWRMKFWEFIEFLFLCAGLAGVGAYEYSIAESWLYQTYDNYRLDAATRGQQTSVLGLTQYLLDTVEGRSSDRMPETIIEPNGVGGSVQPHVDGLGPRLSLNDPVGSIEIPRVEVNTVINEGVDTTTLRRAAGHVPGTALPGQNGNVAIAAHRDTFFRGLRSIEKNDLIRVRTPQGSYEYRVRSTEIVKPSDVHVLNAHGNRELTLITCYPFTFVGHAPSRYIVHADQVDLAESQPVFGPAGAGR